MIIAVWKSEAVFSRAKPVTRGITCTLTNPHHIAFVSSKTLCTSCHFTFTRFPNKLPSKSRISPRHSTHVCDDVSFSAIFSVLQAHCLQTTRCRHGSVWIAALASRQTTQRSDSQIASSFAKPALALSSCKNRSITNGIFSISIILSSSTRTSRRPALASRAPKRCVDEAAPPWNADTSTKIESTNTHHSGLPRR